MRGLLPVRLAAVAWLQRRRFPARPYLETMLAARVELDDRVLAFVAGYRAVAVVRMEDMVADAGSADEDPAVNVALRADAGNSAARGQL
jgi:hypothetical protein